MWQKGQGNADYKGKKARTANIAVVVEGLIILAISIGLQEHERFQQKIYTKPVKHNSNIWYKNHVQETYHIPPSQSKLLICWAWHGVGLLFIIQMMKLKRTNILRNWIF